MSNHKQSSVDYLIEQLLPKALSAEQFYHIQQAKAMQENEYFEVFKAGQESMEEGGKGFEQYYNERFGE